MKQNLIETCIGFAIIFTALIFFTLAYKSANISSQDKGYKLVANFQNIDGIIIGSDVMISGVKVGTVANITLNSETFAAQITIMLDKNIKLPLDTSISVLTSGVLGGKYLLISPGSAEETLREDGEIKYTQSSINIESLIGKLIYSFGSSGK